MEIRDKYGGLQYYHPDEPPLEVSVSASEFSFAFVESKSPMNGVSSLYEVTLTLGVDTPSGAKLAIGLPEELEFDVDQPFKCEGKMLGGSTSCAKDENYERMTFVTLTSDNGKEIVGGTTVIVALGFIKNPISFKPTSSFYVASVIENPNDPGGRVFATPPFLDKLAYYFVNENTDGLMIRNSETGKVTVEEISQSTDELDAATGLTMKFKTMNEIPKDSYMIITLPSNLIMKEPKVEMKVNGESVTPEVNMIAF